MDKTMKAAIFKEKGGDFEIVQIAIPEPEYQWVRIKVHAAGICHSDINIRNQRFGGKLPRVIGHEIVGEIDKLGDGLKDKTTTLEIGQKVGIGFFGGNICHECCNCKCGTPNFCETRLSTSVSFDGGFSEYMVVPYDSICAIPDGMNSCESAPLLCAGVTTLVSIKNNNIPPGSFVGVQGIGGLGHYAIQFLNKLNYKVIAMSSSDEKEQLSYELGATHFINMSNPNWVNKMKEIGSVKCILSTAPNELLIQNLIKSLGFNGKLVLLSLIDNPIQIYSDPFIFENKSIVGSLTGDIDDMYNTLLFSKNNNIKSMIQEIPLEKINDAINNLDKARFRYVIKFN